MWRKKCWVTVAEREERLQGRRDPRAGADLGSAEQMQQFLQGEQRWVCNWALPQGSAHWALCSRVFNGLLFFPGLEGMQRAGKDGRNISEG